MRFTQKHSDLPFKKKCDKRNDVRYLSRNSVPLDFVPAIFLTEAEEPWETKIDAYMEKKFICYTLQLRNQGIFGEHQLKVDTRHVHLTGEPLSTK